MNNASSTEKVMVIRDPSFEPYWARPLSFGPMNRAKAEEMVASRWGGRVLSLPEWYEGLKKGYYR